MTSADPKKSNPDEHSSRPGGPPEGLTDDEASARSGSAQAEPRVMTASPTEVAAPAAPAAHGAPPEPAAADPESGPPASPPAPLPHRDSSLMRSRGRSGFAVSRDQTPIFYEVAGRY